MIAQAQAGGGTDALIDDGTVSAVAAYLQQLYLRHLPDEDGEVATYIPELAHVDPSLFGICLATVDGAVYEAGDTRVPFTIQSMSKPLTYGLALERLGRDAVRSRIGVEPSGDAFNELSLSSQTRKPPNPLINAGAMACAGLVAADADDPFALLLETYSRYAGRELELDEAVFRSEAETGHRNRGMAHILRGFGVLDEPEAALDLYFRQCSISVECRDLAMMAATLANGGLNPLTGERAVGEGVVRDVLSVMATCGMYDFAGEWLVSVGLPAKSGVSGGVFAVLPGRLGIAVFSPRVDAQGNTVRGIAVCRELSHDLAVHLVRPGERPAPSLRSVYTPADRGSKRERSPAHRAALRAAADRALVVELQGELGFSASEALARRLEEQVDPPELVVIDLSRVVRADAGGTRFIIALADRITRGAAASRSRPRGAAARARRPARNRQRVRRPRPRARVVRGRAAAAERRRACADRRAARGARAARRTVCGELARLLPELGAAAVPAGRCSCARASPRPRSSWSRAAPSAWCARARTARAAVSRRSRPAGRSASSRSSIGVHAPPTCGPTPRSCARPCRTRPSTRWPMSDPAIHGTLVRNLLGVVVATLRIVNDEVAHLTR